MANQVSLSDIRRYFDRDDWKYEVVDEARIRFGVKMNNASYKALVRFQPEKDLISLFIYYPFEVPENRRLEVAEVVTRMNYGLSFGWCEMDLKDGETRFRSFLAVDDAPFYPNQFKTILNTGFSTTDKYYPAFMGVLFGGKTPQAAIEEVEGTR